MVPFFSVTFQKLVMDNFVDLCHSFGLPAWIAFSLRAAKRLRSDRARRRKAYRLLQRSLVFHGVGVMKGCTSRPTYIYPNEVKMLMRAAFPQDICDYPDPAHEQVVYISMEDLHSVDVS